MCRSCVIAQQPATNVSIYYICVHFEAQTEETEPIQDTVFLVMRTAKEANKLYKTSHCPMGHIARPKSRGQGDRVEGYALMGGTAKLCEQAGIIFGANNSICSASHYWDILWKSR